MQLKTRIKKINPYIRSNFVPLGRRVLYDGDVGGTVTMRLPTLNDSQISDSILIIGRTGSGKSVALRLIYWWVSKIRPIIVFDYVGRDHYLSKLRNTMPYNLPEGIEPKGINGKYYYYPVVGARPKASWEVNVRPNITKYNVSQLERLGFSDTASRYIKNIFQRYGPFKNMDELYEFVANFPSSRTDWLKHKKWKLKHKKPYEENDYISSQTKPPMIRTLYSLVSMNVFETDDQFDINIVKDLASGKNLFFSFNNLMVARCEIDYMFKQIESYRDTYKDGKRHFVFIEEAHDVFDRVLANFIAVCRKLSVGIALCMPLIPDSIPDSVLYDIKNVICGKLKGSHHKVVANLISDDQANRIPYLRSNQYTGEREMMYYSGHWDKVFGPIKMFACPQEMHREF